MIHVLNLTKYLKLKYDYKINFKILKNTKFMNKKNINMIN